MNTVNQNIAQCTFVMRIWSTTVSHSLNSQDVSVFPVSSVFKQVPLVWVEHCQTMRHWDSFSRMSLRRKLLAKRRKLKGKKLLWHEQLWRNAIKTSLGIIWRFSFYNKSSKWMNCQSSDEDILCLTRPNVDSISLRSFFYTFDKLWGGENTPSLFACHLSPLFFNR